MSHTPDLSPRAQAILRAIENEAQARRISSAAAGQGSPPDLASSQIPALSADDSADRLRRLVDHVVAQTENIRAHTRQIEESLDGLSRVLNEPVARGRQGPTPASERPPEDSRVTAIELALSGANRGEVRAHLVTELGVSGPEPILDDIFGAGSGDSARTPWHG